MTRDRVQTRRPQGAESGFTLVELLLVVTIVGMLAGMIAERVAPMLNRYGSTNASTVVGVDLEQAVSLAVRQRRPVRITLDSTRMAYTFTDRGNGTLLFRRALKAPDGGFPITSISFSTNPVDVFPSGLTSAALTVTVNAGSTSHQVTMSQGAFVRVIR